VAREPGGLQRWLIRLAARLASDAEVGDLVEACASRPRSTGWLAWQVASLAGRSRRHSPALDVRRRDSMFTSMWSDARYTLRMLRRHPAFAAAAIVPIAFGIGLTTGVFSLIDSALLQPIRVPKPDELVTVYQDFRGGPKRRVNGARVMFSLPEFETYRDGTRALSGAAAYSKSWSATLGGRAPQEVEGIVVTCGYFELLRVRPALGPGFTAANCATPSAPPALILSHGLWTRVFGADPGIIGRPITLNGQAVNVVGVAPAGFDGIDLTRTEFFASTAFRPEAASQAELSWLAIVARRRPDAVLAQVRAELAVIASRIDREKPGRTTTLIVEPATAVSLPFARREALTLGSVVLIGFGLILLVASANVANVLLARAAGRTREIAIRLSMGAGRRRLIRQLLTEAAIVVMLGAVAGLLLAWWSFHALLVWVFANLPATMSPLTLAVHPTSNVFWFALGLTAITTLVCGLVPALQASNQDVRSSLNRDDEAAHGRTGWLRGAFIAAQVAGCMVLLVSAALLLRALHAVETRDPGFDYEQVAVVSVPLRGPGYDEASVGAFQQRLLDEVEALPGVRAVARLDRVPLSPGRTQATFRLPQQEQVHDVDFNTVGPGYFALLRIPLVRGRTFTADEASGSAHAVVVTESTARRLWPGEDPVGRTIVMGETPLTVVGVARDTQISNVADVASSYVYLPAAPRGHGDLRMVARLQTDQAGFAAGVAALAKRLDPGLVVSVYPLEQHLTSWQTESRVIAGVSGSLSLLALALASVGVYGVVGYVVGRRRREIGIRMALGATRADVQRQILRQTFRPVALGVVAGIAGAAVASRSLEAVLFGVSPLDPAAFVSAALFLAGVASAAILVPTRAALKADPTTTLRYD
jgi:predicted permease